MNGPAVLFEQLDCRELQSRGRTGVVHIYAVREIEEQYWIQLEVVDDEAVTTPLIVRAPLTVTSAAILDRLTGWLARRDREAVRTLKIESE